jgi:hypothetical protein
MMKKYETRDFNFKNLYLNDLFKMTESIQNLESDPDNFIGYSSSDPNK